MIMQRRQYSRHFQTPTIDISLLHYLMMYLPQYNSSTFARHITRSNTMFNSISCERVLFQDTDTASRQRHRKGSITEPIQLTPERQSAIREQPHTEDRLTESMSIIEMLG